MTGKYVDQLKFSMRGTGEEFVYGKGGHKECEVWLEPGEAIISIKQITRPASLGQFILKTSKGRELKIHGCDGFGKTRRTNNDQFFECLEGHQIHSLEFDDSVLVGIHQIRFSPRTDEGNEG